MKTSENIDQIATAMAAAQKKITNPIFNSKGQAGLAIFNYADLGAVLGVIREPLEEQGLSFQQDVDVPNKLWVTKIMHKSGQWMETTFPFEPLVRDMKTLGANATYIRRYSLCAAFQIFGEADLDAKDDEGRDLKNHDSKDLGTKGKEGVTGITKPPVKEEPLIYITNAQIKKLNELFNELPDIKIKALQTYNADSVEKVQAKHYDILLDRLKVQLAIMRGKEAEALEARNAY